MIYLGALAILALVLALVRESRKRRAKAFEVEGSSLLDVLRGRRK
jgi:hypothetical protein